MFAISPVVQDGLELMLLFGTWADRISHPLCPGADACGYPAPVPIGWRACVWLGYEAK